MSYLVTFTHVEGPYSLLRGVATWRHRVPCSRPGPWPTPWRLPAPGPPSPAHTLAQLYTVKKLFNIPVPPQPDCHLPNSPWAGIRTSYVNYSRLGRLW